MTTTPTIEVMHADIMDLDADFFGLFDALLTDPPYSEHVHGNCASVGSAAGNGAGDLVRSGLGAHARDLGFEHLSDALRAQIGLAAESVTRWSAIYSDVESTHLWRAACARAEYIRPLPWIRWSQPQLSGDRPCTILEIVSLFHAQHNGPRGGTKPHAKHWNGPGNPIPEVTRELGAPLLDRALRGDGKHPTEKRLTQTLSLVSWLSDPGEHVLSLCSGSGSTELACRLLDRECFGVELDEEWAGKAERRAKNMLSPRDRADAEEWCGLVLEEANQTIATSDALHARAQAAIDELTAAGDTSSAKFKRAQQRLIEDRNTRERAERRIADVERVMVKL